MKQIKINLTTVFLIIVILFQTGCTSDFDEMNINPNAAEIVPATNVLASAIVTSIGPIWDTRMNCYYTGAYSGMFGAADYEYRNSINDGMWNEMYRIMSICHDAMLVAEKEQNDNIYAAALTFNAFCAQLTTDCWGDIPYSEAFRLEESIDFMYPHYDKQKDVYIKILEELKEAADLFDDNGLPIGNGDFIFNGNISKWRKFCNSLRLRVAIRASSGELSVATPTISEVLGNPSKYPVITGNEDNAYWWFPGRSPYYETWYNNGLKRDENGTKDNVTWRAQQPFVDALQDNNDPRLSVYFDANSRGEYAGHRFGPDERNTPVEYEGMGTTLWKATFGDRFTNDPAGFLPLMNCAEVYFCIAEAYLHGIGVQASDGNAKEAYEAGITASCLENGISAADIDVFLGGQEVAWTTGATSKRDKIALQKWIVLIKQSINAWAEVRRTDVPDLSQYVQEAYYRSHNRPPFRMAYSDSEKSLNPNFPNYINSVQYFWGDQLWWDKRANVY